MLGYASEIPGSNEINYGSVGPLCTHLSCLVWFTMERTLSSPSILGLPNSSSFTCCREQSRAQPHSQACSHALGPQAVWIAPPSPARAPGSCTSLTKGMEDAPGRNSRTSLELQHWHPRARLSTQSIFANSSPPPTSFFFQRFPQ